MDSEFTTYSYRGTRLRQTRSNLNGRVVVGIYQLGDDENWLAELRCASLHPENVAGLEAN
jgi:hypothetical protein